MKQCLSIESSNSQVALTTVFTATQQTLLSMDESTIANYTETMLLATWLRVAS